MQRKNVSYLAAVQSTMLRISDFSVQATSFYHSWFTSEYIHTLIHPGVKMNTVEHNHPCTASVVLL